MTRLKPWLRETVIVIRTWTSDCSRWFYIDVIRYPCPHLKAGSASLWKWKRTWKIMYIYQSYHGIRTKFWRSKSSDRFFKHLAVLDINCFAVEIVISAGTLGSRLGYPAGLVYIYFGHLRSFFAALLLTGIPMLFLFATQYTTTFYHRNWQLLALYLFLYGMDIYYRK